MRTSRVSSRNLPLPQQRLFWRTFSTASHVMALLPPRSRVLKPHHSSVFRRRKTPKMQALQPRPIRSSKDIVARSSAFQRRTVPVALPHRYFQVIRLGRHLRIQATSSVICQRVHRAAAMTRMITSTITSPSVSRSRILKNRAQVPALPRAQAPHLYTINPHRLLLTRQTIPLIYLADCQSLLAKMHGVAYSGEFNWELMANQFERTPVQIKSRTPL